MVAAHGLVEVGLPSYLTRFIGREDEIAFLAQLIDGDIPATASPTHPAPRRCRLLTLTGVGGSGKTRLALEVARDFTRAKTDGVGGFADGVHWVALGPVTVPDRVPQVVAAAFALREAAGLNPLDALVNRLKDQHTLLVLDNCEHLAAVCRDLIRVLLPSCPTLVILATSRTPLQLPNETIFAVPPLQTVEADTTRSGEDFSPSEAARLFLDRAAMVAPAVSATRTTARTIGLICQRLDGLPLAIELSASWMRVLNARDLLAEIDRSITFLTSSAPGVAQRHRSMRAVLESSWSRLAEQDQQVFSALAVFVGSFSRDAAEKVAGASLSSLSALAEKSMIQRLPDSENETRYHIHELVRQYALERLGASDGAEVAAARHRHLDYYLRLVERAEEAWDSAAEGEWLDRLRTDQPNVNAALMWALEHQRSEQALRLVSGLFAFWIYASPPGLYLAALEDALVLPWDPMSPAVTRARAKALNVAGYAAAHTDASRSRHLFEEGLRLYRVLGDDRSVAWSLRGRSYLARVVGNAAQGQPDEERSLSMCRAIKDLRGEAWSVHDLGEIAYALGDLDRAEQLLEEGLARFEEHGVSFGAYRALIMLGDTRRRKGHWLDALSGFSKALSRQRQLHFVQRGADIMEGIAAVAVVMHQPAYAARLFGAGQAWRHTFGDGRYVFNETDYQRQVAAARKQLGPTAWSEHDAAGGRLTAEEAMVEARRRAEELGSPAGGGDGAGLTDRELEVLRAVARGLSSPDIAAQLVVSPRTVHAHLRSIFDKLDVSTRTAAAHEAVRLHLV
jgi:predicted ATPase/DNA-binding CsgD family transcriptional regulator